MSAGHEELRSRAASALEAARPFVALHGGSLTRLRADVALGVVAAVDAVRTLSKRRARDGSFGDFGAEGGLFARELAPGSGATQIGGTLQALGLLAEWGALAAPDAEPAARFLERCQLAEGSWGVAEDDPELRVVATATLASMLARTPFARPATLGGAERFLAAHWSPDRVEGGEWASLTAFAAAFANLPSDVSDEALQWCGRELERGFRSRRFDALATVRVLLCCDGSGLPGSSLEPTEIVEGLLAEQASDGGFAVLETEGPSFRAAASVDAIRGLIALCRVL